MKIILLAGIIIIVLGVIIEKNKLKYREVKSGIQRADSMIQPIVLDNGQAILTQINIDYEIVDKKKAKKAVNGGVNIAGNLRYESIIQLRRLVDNVDNIESIIEQLENDLKDKLSEIGQTFGVEVKEVHIHLINKNEFCIKNKNGNQECEGTLDNETEETSKSKYNFEVCMKTPRGRWSSKNTIFSTKINIQKYTLNYKLSRKYNNSEKYLEHLEKKYNSFDECSKTINLYDILSIKYKVGFAFAKCLYDLMAIIFIIFAILSPFLSQIYFCLRSAEMLMQISISLNWPLYIVSALGLLIFAWYFTCKCIEIKYKTDTEIKKITFPISRTFFGSTSSSTKKMIDELCNEIRKVNENIKIKKDRLKWIIVCYLIISLGIYVSLPIYFHQEYLRENDLEYNKNNNLVYCNVSFDKGRVVNIRNKKTSGGNWISEYEFELTNGEKIKIDDYNKKYGEVYNVCIENYYKKDTNQLFKTNYLIRENTDVTYVWINYAEYIYDYIGNKMFKLNFLDSNNIQDFETKIYYRKNGNTNTLYNFINYGGDTISITDDFDVIEFKINNYDSLEKLETYMSVYGRCYVLKAYHNEQVDYLMYIENSKKSNINELDAVMINSRIDRTRSFKNDVDAIRSFKIICGEVQ